MNPVLRRTTAVVVMLFVVASTSGLAPGFDTSAGSNSPPAVRAPAEWETTETVLVRWGPEYTTYYVTLTRELAAVTQVNIVVSNQSERTTIRRVLRRDGTSMRNVSFFVAPTDTIWIRDYGPVTIVDRDTGQRSFVDARYSNLRTADDAFPARYANASGAILRTVSTADADLWFDGGNFMVDGAGSLFTTDDAFRLNAPRYGGNLAPAVVRARLKDAFGLTAVANVSAAVRDGPGHIDMQAKLLNETTVVVAAVPPTDADYAVLESTTAYFETHRARNGQPYRVYRVPMPTERTDLHTTYYSYTNSLIVNGTVLVPTYGLPTDAEALAVYREALPGYEIVGVNATAIADGDGAIHCTTLGIPAPNPSPRVQSLDAAVDPDGTVVVRATASDDGRLDAMTLYHSTSSKAGIERVAMTRTAAGTYVARLSRVPEGAVVRYFVVARDDDGAVTYAGDAGRMRLVRVE